MASILDTGLVNLFTGIFVFLLVYSVVWGFLTWRKIFGDNKGVYAMVAFVLAFMAAIAPPVRFFITFIAPWYLAFIMVLFFILFIITLFGLSSDKDFPGIIKDTRVYTTILVVSVVIFLAGLAFTLGQQSLELTQGGAPEGSIMAPGSVGPSPGMPGSTATSSYSTNLANTLFHPKVLGLAVTFLRASLAVYFLSTN